MHRPGDRKYRWKTACQAEAMIMFFVSIMLVATMSIAGFILAALAIGMTMISIREADRGWAMKEKRMGKRARAFEKRLEKGAGNEVSEV